LIALVLILLLLIGSFRTWKNPFFAVIALVVAILWTAGFLAMVLHYLNMMSVAFVIILVGLGIDFGIHMISGFKDGRERGRSPGDAIRYAYDRAGPGIVTGAMTTAIVFFALTLTGFQAFAEMGIAIGSGIIITMLAALVLLPALMMWDNKGYSVLGRFFRKAKLTFMISAWSLLIRIVYGFFRLPIFRWLTGFLQFGFLDISGKLLLKVPVAAVVLLLGTAAMVASYIAGTRIEFEYDMMELEPVGIPSVIAQDKIIEKFEISPDYAMLKAADLDDCRDQIMQIKKIGNRTGVIGGVDGITEFIPDEDMQRENRIIIELFREKMNAMQPESRFSATDVGKLEKELFRLHQNIVEIGELSVMGSGEENKIIRKCDRIVGKTDEDSKILMLSKTVATLADKPESLAPYQKIMGEVLKERLLAMCSTDIVTIENLPDDIRERYISPKSGKLLITVYPKSNIWEERNLRKFYSESMKVSERVTGTPVIMLLFIDLMKEKGRIAIMLGAIAIVLFLLADFRSTKYTIFAIIPLMVGAFWMVGAMAALGMKFNIVNFMCLPLILGIGIDDGVHILHRYRKEGRLSIPAVLKYTGRAILLTSLTTMIGFGSMGLASHRGTASMGQVLFLGVGACFLSSAFVLPAVITIWENLFPGKKAS
jgi:predicted RND superfamily exporter protein